MHLCYRINALKISFYVIAYICFTVCLDKCCWNNKFFSPSSIISLWSLWCHCNGGLLRSMIWPDHFSSRSFLHDRNKNIWAPQTCHNLPKLVPYWPDSTSNIGPIRGRFGIYWYLYESIMKSWLSAPVRWPSMAGGCQCVAMATSPAIHLCWKKGLCHQ